MRRLSTLLFLTVSIFTIAWGQAENDLCANAIPVQLGPVLNCPNDTPTETLVAGSTIDATSTQPAIRLSDFDQNLSFIAQSADVWYTFTAIASQTTISISGGLEQPVLILFQNSGCNNQFPVGIEVGAAGSLNTSLSARTEPGSTYSLLVSSGDFGAQGDFNLSITSQNQCDVCGERRGQITAQPAPLNGTYETGQQVTFCYTPTLWAPGFSLEWLHGLDIDFGPGWDLTSLTTSAPDACTAPDGAWAWYNNWESCNSGDSYGPGFAFDSKRGLLCPGVSANDGLPGNNFGDGPCGNLEPAPLSLEFCWTVTVKSNFSTMEEANLNIDVTMLGDGTSGSWMMASCDPEVTSSFYATAVPPSNIQPEVSVLQPSCPSLCNGRISFSGGSNLSFSLLNSDGLSVFNGTGPSLNTVVSDLCPGQYQFVIVDGANEQSINIEVPATDLPDIQVDYTPACFEGDPYLLESTVGGSTSNLEYNWSGPGNFSSNLPSPTVLNTGTYTLSAVFNNCPIPDEEVTVTDRLPELSCETTESTIIFHWTEDPTDTAYTAILLSGQTGQLLNEQSFLLSNLSPGESATLELTVEGLDDCPLKMVEKTCTTNICPQPDAGPDTLLCTSGGIHLSVAANAGDIISWVPGDGLSCTDCANPVAEPGETTTYQVTITNAQGCVGIDFVTIYVDEVPGDVIPEEPLVFCPGSPFSLCLPEENQYLWISPIGFIQTGNCLKFPYTSPSIAGQYTLRVELPNGCRITESIELIVGPGCNSFAAPAPSTGTASMLRVFPNPASNHIQIRTSMTGLKQFTLRAMDGRTISQFKQESDAFEFGLQGISSGSYILEMIGESGVEQQILSVH